MPKAIYKDNADTIEGVKLCPTPEALVDALMYGYTGLLEYRATLGRRELNDGDMAQVEAARQAMLAKLNG